MEPEIEPERTSRTSPPSLVDGGKSTSVYAVCHSGQWREALRLPGAAAGVCFPHADARSGKGTATPNAFEFVPIKA